MATKKFILGFIILLVAATSLIFILDNDKLQIKHTATSSTFSVKENGQFIVSGVEQVYLYAGSKQLRKNASSLTYNQSGNFVTAIRTIKYNDGFPFIVETYTFRTDTSDVEEFPTTHDITVHGGWPGLILRYDVSKLNYSGPTRDAKSPESFGLKMRVEFQGGFKSAKVLSSRILRVEYPINESTQTFKVRLYDPIVRATKEGTAIALSNRGFSVKIDPEFKSGAPPYEHFVTLTNNQLADVSVVFKPEFLESQYNVSIQTVKETETQYEEPTFAFVTSKNETTRIETGKETKTRIERTFGPASYLVGNYTFRKSILVPAQSTLKLRVLYFPKNGAGKWNFNLYTTDESNPEIFIDPAWDIVSPPNVHLKMDGNSNDSSGNRVNFLQVGSPNWSTTSFKTSTGSLNLTSTTQFLNITDNANLEVSAGQDFAMSFWLMLNTSGTGVNGACGIYGKNGTSINMGIQHDTLAPAKHFSMYDYGINAPLTSTSAVKNNSYVWYLIQRNSSAGIGGGAALTLFINNVQQNRTNATGFDGMKWNNTANAIIGDDGQGTRCPNGTFDDWRMIVGSYYDGAARAVIYNNGFGSNYPANDTLLVNGALSNYSIELGTPMPASYANGCLDFDHPSYGQNFSCSSGPVLLDLNVSYFRTDTFNDSTKERNLTYATHSNQSINVSAHQFDEVDGMTLNLTGVASAGVLPADVNVFINGTISNRIGNLFAGGYSTLSVFNESSPAKNVSFNASGVAFIGALKLPKNATILSGTVNITGFANVSNGSFTNQSLWRIGNQTHTVNRSKFFTEAQIGGLFNSSTGPIGNSSASPSQFSNMTYELSFTGRPRNISVRMSYLLSTSWDFIGRRIDLYNFNTGSFEKVYDGTSTVTANPSLYCFMDNFSFPISAQHWNGTVVRIMFVHNASEIGIGTDPGSDIFDCDGYHFNPSGRVSMVNMSIRPINMEQYPFNPYVEVGAIDGVREFQYANNYSISNVSRNLTNATQRFLSQCTADTSGLCNVPIYVSSQNPGILMVDRIVLNYDAALAPVHLSTSLIQGFLNRSNGRTTIPITISNSANSTIKVSDVRYDYAGGNKTYVLRFHDFLRTANTTVNLTYHYSRIELWMPPKIEFLEFIPQTSTSKNVSPYGQTANRSIFNITTMNYGLPLNLSIRLNESFSCVNLSYAKTLNTSQKVYLANNTWFDLGSNLAQRNNVSVYLFADLNCNASQWMLWSPYIALRGCAMNSVCSEVARTGI